MAKKECELCNNPARMFCESDQASLCWDCDEKVHAANFLVAKHSRTLLCHVCRSPTTWKAAGAKLGPTVSICQACVEHGENRGTVAPAASSSRRENGDGYESQESESDDGEYYSDSDDFSEEEEEEDVENQVVPWSETGYNSKLPPSAAASSSSSTEENLSFSTSKRTRESPNFESEDEDGCCSSHNLDTKLSFQDCDENYGSSSSSLSRPFKMRRRSSESELTAVERDAIGEAQVSPPSGTAAIIEKLRRFQQEIATKGDASEMILGLSKLTRSD